MKKLYIKGFRAFNKEVTISLENSQENVLLYGENGSGKSSIFEALKLLFFYNREEQKIVEGAISPQDRAQKISQWKGQQICKLSTANDFTIQLDDADYGSTLDVSKYCVYMLSNEDVPVKESVSVRDLISSLYYTGLDANAFCTADNMGFVRDYVNDALATDFLETVKIDFDQTAEYNLKVTDDSIPGLNSTMQLTRHFNEAKLKLINLLILLAVAELSMNINDDTKIRILILDDIVNSLDVANRGLLIKYIFKEFPDGKVRKFVMTHNVSYYNLWTYYVNDFHAPTSGKWLFTNLYVKGQERFVYEDSRETVQSIRTVYNSTPNDPSICNRIRQYFEVLLFEMSKILQVGSFNESSKLIEDLARNRKFYVKVLNNGKPKYVDDLVNEIEGLIKHVCVVDCRAKVRNLVAKYNDSNEYMHLMDIVDDLKLYQKLALHQASHGHTGKPTIGEKEIMASLDLLEKMEAAVKLGKNKDVYTV